MSSIRKKRFPTEMDNFDDNDLDQLVDRHAVDDGPNEYSELQDHGVQEEKEDKKRIVPVKIRTKNPQPKLNSERLRGSRGLSVLPKWFENIKLKGKGHESEDLNAIINRLEQWTHRLFPRYTFDDIIAKLEKLGKKNEVQVMLKRIRMDMDNNDFVLQTEDDVAEPPTQVDAFDQLVNNVDIFPVISTQGVRNTGLTEEQRQRMMHNRMLAEERRQAKIRVRREQELNAFSNSTATASTNITTTTTTATTTTTNSL